MIEHASVAVDEAYVKEEKKQQEIGKAVESRMPKRQFAVKDLSSRQKVRMVVQIIAQIAMAIWTLRDIRRRPASEIRGSKWLWTVAAFIQPVGTPVYVLFGRKRG